MKAVLHYRASAGFRAALARDAAAARVDTAVVDETDDAGFAREMADAHVLLHVLQPVTAAMITQAPRLKLVQKLGVGVNTIDLDACKAAGVAVANMPGVNSQAVAEMALALMLSVLRRLSYLDPLTRRAESSVMLDRGATVLLYTDGLVERRGQDLDEGLALLRETLTELVDLPLDELCDVLLRRMLPVEAEDDVALVAVRLHLQDGPRPAEAGPERVPPNVPDEP